MRWGVATKWTRSQGIRRSGLAWPDNLPLEVSKTCTVLTLELSKGWGWLLTQPPAWVELLGGRFLNYWIANPGAAESRAVSSVCYQPSFLGLAATHESLVSYVSVTCGIATNWPLCRPGRAGSWQAHSPTSPVLLTKRNSWTCLFFFLKKKNQHLLILLQTIIIIQPFAAKLS